MATLIIQTRILILFISLLIISQIFQILIYYEESPKCRRQVFLEMSKTEEETLLESSTIEQILNQAKSINNIPFLTVEDFLKQQRKLIASEMQNYQQPSINFSTNASNLAELIPETAGSSIKNIIISSWRCGSTFLGDILNSMPGSFYHYEPVLPFGVFKIRESPYDDKAIDLIKKLFKCDYSAIPEYTEYFINYNWDLIEHNSRLNRICGQFPEFCYHPKFLEPFCKLFPLQIMKIVRMRLSVAEKLLLDKSLNVKIIYLVRDPRGFMQSRKQHEWCDSHSDCSYVENACSDLLDDYQTVKKFSKLYPKAIKLVRYEDLSMSPFEVTKDILEFYGLPFDERVNYYLESHTKSDLGGPYSTFRNSKSTPSRWINEMQYSEILKIQEVCKEPMELLGYKLINNSDILTEFNTVLELPGFS